MDLKKMDDLILSWQGEVFQKLKTWIAIDSVKAEPAPGAPFGKNVRKALDLFLKDAKAMGFETYDCDGYAGHAQFGSGPETMGILAHLDIVPAGDGWTQNPFGGEIVDGKCYGRGTIDDKGPLLAALYALRAVKEAGIPLKDGVRIIAGCDEETGMSDMRYYAGKLQMPDYGFSPDAEYPLINIEKGGLNLLVGADVRPERGEKLQVFSLHAGERVNVVPGTATAEVGGVPVNELSVALKVVEQAHEGFQLSVAPAENRRATITATGVGAHASMPHLGRNAAGMLLIALKELGAAMPFAGLAEALGMEGDGRSLGIALSDELSGALTCNLGLLRYDGERLTAQLDIRYPISANEDILVARAESALEGYGLSLTKGGSHPPLHVPKDHKVVRGLLEVYHEQTGLPAYAMAIGGGTYSRMMPNTVAFGINFPGDNDPCHMPDEYVFVDKFMLSIRIMAHAIVRLAGKNTQES